MEVTHISSEFCPNSKAGFLGDVLETLPKIQNVLGHNTSVIMPLYHKEYSIERSLKNIFKGTVVLDRLKFPFSIYQESSSILGYDLFLVSIPGLFDSNKIYTYNDDTERVLAFQFAILDWFLSKETIPEIIHCHDHQSFLIPFLITQVYKYEKLKNIPTIITIHDEIFQGQFGFDKIHYFPEFNLDAIKMLVFENCINPMVSAVKCSSMIAPISLSYLNEPLTNSYLVGYLLKSFEKKYSKILNPIAAGFLNQESGKVNQDLKKDSHKKIRIPNRHLVKPAELVNYHF